jgi:GMP synthase (glutamine-hydrolysing)
MLRLRSRGNGVKCVAVRHLKFEDLGILEEVLIRRGFDIAYFEAGQDSFDALAWEAADLIVLLGGPIGVYETADYPWLREEIDIVGRRLRLDRPTLGICLGAQIMAAALGASVCPGPAKEIGWSKMHLTPAAKTYGPEALAQTEVLHWHGDTFELPEGATLLASTYITQHQAFSYGRTALALQFHAEASGARMESWLIGHTMELRNTRIDINQLRQAGLTDVAKKTVAGQNMLEQWLSHVGLA